ncbi:MAG: SGNH/GDSL hydrolase family protein [Bacteroidales bacterium]|nr:SGNH/GDSL hydrolase family protein [Bacteroidales bacterium]
MSTHKRKFGVNIFIALVSLLICTAIAEVTLRISGYTPGLISPEWLNFKEVDSLETYLSFYTDERGIFRANKDYYKNEFYINNDGFRSPEFEKDSIMRSILFLGDSYTWGSKAEPISNCFVEQVGNHGFNVYNTGIPGADPPQYYAIAGEYVPKLKPDIVCLMFYAGNDFIEKDRDVEPFHNIFHVTNAGWLSPYIEDSYVSCPLIAYNYYLQKYKIGDEAPLWKRILAQTAVGTLILSVPERLKERKTWQKNNEIALKYVNLIKNLCSENGCEFYFFLIPLHTKISTDQNAAYSAIFKGIDVHIPEDITKDDYYKWPNGHLNNEGHQKYARKILEVIQ